MTSLSQDTRKLSLMPIIPLTLTVLSNGAVPVYVNLVGMILHGYYRSTSFSIKTTNNPFKTN